MIFCHHVDLIKQWWRLSTVFNRSATDLTLNVFFYILSAKRIYTTLESLEFKGPLQWKNSNRQNYKCRVVYLKTSNLRNLVVYHCNIYAQRKKFILSNEPSTNFCMTLCDIDINYEVYRLCVFVLLFTFMHENITKANAKFRSHLR